MHTILDTQRWLCLISVSVLQSDHLGVLCHQSSTSLTPLPHPPQFLFSMALQVKRCYMRANLLVHPDKVSQKGGSLEQVVTADIAFDILKVAW